MNWYGRVRECFTHACEIGRSLSRVMVKVRHWLVLIDVQRLEKDLYSCPHLCHRCLSQGESQLSSKFGKVKVKVTREYWIRDFDMTNVATTALYMDIRYFGMMTGLKSM